MYFYVFNNQIWLQGKDIKCRRINKFQIRRLIMSSRNSGSFYNKNRRRDASSKYPASKNASESESEQIDYKRIRVIQKNLVYAIGLTDSISSNETLESDNYFGKYGRVLKTIINKTTNPTTKSQRNTAYVTFESQFEASLAILALDDHCLAERPMKVSYGTTKYCSYFLKKYECPNIKDCYFLHKWDVDNELTVDDNSKQVFNKQLKIAMRVVASNLPQTLKKHRSNLRKNLGDSPFPDIEQAVQKLLDQGLISEDELDAFRQDPSDSPRSDSKSHESVQQNNCKCDSISTSGTPVKQTKEDLQSKSQMPSDDTTMCVDAMIHKYMSKVIMKQSKLSQSRFGFAEKNMTPLEDAQKIKKYIEVYIGPNSIGPKKP